jgi:hypothetical protein
LPAHYTGRVHLAVFIRPGDQVKHGGASCSFGTIVPLDDVPYMDFAEKAELFTWHWGERVGRGTSADLDKIAAHLEIAAEVPEIWPKEPQ